MGIFDIKPTKKEKEELANEPKSLKEQVVDAICKVYDPEIPVNIYELGLIYTVELEGDGEVLVEMTLTSPQCPAAQELPVDVKYRVEEVEGITNCDVDIVWDPPWGPEKMSDTAKLELGFF